MLKIKKKPISIKVYEKKDINLLPKEIFQKKQKIYKTISFVLLVLVVTVSMFGYYLYLDFQLKELDRRNEILSRKINQLLQEEIQQKILSYLEEKIKIKNVHLMILEKNNLSIPYIVSVIEDNLPKDIHFVNLAVSSTGELTISGYADSDVSIAEFIHNLKESKVFRQVFVGNITSSSRNKSEIYSFSLICHSRRKQE